MCMQFLVNMAAVQKGPLKGLLLCILLFIFQLKIVLFKIMENTT